MGVIALALIVATAVVIRARGGDEPDLAQIDVAREAVNIDKGGAGNPIPAADADPQLAVGDRITTDADGLGTVNWFDGSLTRLGGNADFRVEELGEEGDRKIVGHLEFGESWHRVQEATGSGSRFEVRTSNAVASVRGTAFLVRCIPNCRYGVASGQVQVVTDGGESATLDGGEQVEEDEDGDLGEIEPLDTDDPWLQMNQDLDEQIDDELSDGESSEADDESATDTSAPSTTAPPTTEPPATSTPPTSTPASRPSGGDDGDTGLTRSTTSTGTIPTSPSTTTTTTPPTSIPPTATSEPPTSAPSPTFPPTTSQPEPTTSSSTSSSSTTSSSTTSSSTTSSSTTSSSTTSTSAPTTTTPPTTSPPVTSPPSGPGPGTTHATTSSTTSSSTTSSSTTSSSTTSSSTTSTTESPPDTGTISGAVNEPPPDGSTDVTVGGTSLVDAPNGLALACPHAPTEVEPVCHGASVESDGTWTIVGVPAGKWDVFAVPPEDRTDLDLSNEVLVELAAGGVVTGVELTFAKAVEKFALSGTVRDSHEDPVEGATVVAGIEDGCACGEAVTSADGTYTMLLPAGTYLVHAFKDDLFADTATVVIEGPTTKNFFLSAPEVIAGSISGTVSGADGPVVGADVAACPNGGTCFNTVSGAGGVFAFAGLPFATYELSAESGPTVELMLSTESPEVTDLALTTLVPEDTTPTTFSLRPTPPASETAKPTIGEPRRQPRAFGSPPAAVSDPAPRPAVAPALAAPRQPRAFGTPPPEATRTPPAPPIERPAPPPPPPPRQPRAFGTAGPPPEPRAVVERPPPELEPPPEPVLTPA